MQPVRFICIGLVVALAACTDPAPVESTAEIAVPAESAASMPEVTTPEPLVFRMAGYGPPTTSFSRGLTRIGEELSSRLGDEVDPRYVYNILEAGYEAGGDLSWLVESGLLTLAYATMGDGIPELELAALPFVFADTDEARAAMDGALGDAAARRIESQLDVRVLGFFENGFRHVSNSVRAVRTPADLDGLTIRVLPVQSRTFELLGAVPQPLPLTQVVERLADRRLDGQENPFANTVTYNLYPHQRYHTATYHSYLSRAIFMTRQTYDSLSPEFKQALEDAVRAAVAFQRELKDEEELAAAETIREAGGEIVELTDAERQLFVDAVAPIYDEAREKFSPEQLALVGLR